jgi:hypothetical protein
VKTIWGVIAAALMGAASTGAWSADNLGEKEGAELRQRAQEFHNERTRNPDFQPGEGRSAPEADRATTKRSKRAAKADAPVQKTQGKEPVKDQAKRKARSLKKIPGAFVRR